MKNKGAVNAILKVYKKSIDDLMSTIDTITDKQLIEIIGNKDINDECSSIQNILAHVVNSGYSYINYIQNHRKVIVFHKPKWTSRNTIEEFKKDLEKMFRQSEIVFADIYDDELERFSQDEKIHTNWKQYYDIEQIMEHAIVHIMRHELQIKNILQNNFK